MTLAAQLQAWRGVSRRAVALCFSNLSMLLQCGVNVVRALEILEQQETDEALREVLGPMKWTVVKGNALSRAMAGHEAAFTAVQVALVRAGEDGGCLPAVLTRLAHIGDREVKLAARLRATCTYPAVVLVLALLIMLSVAHVVVGSFLPVLMSSGLPIPLMTRMLVAMASPLGICVVLAGAGGAAWGLRHFVATPQGRHRIAELSLGIPMIGPAVLKVELARALRLLGALYNSGMPILTALRMLDAVTSHAVIAARLRQVAADVTEGVPLGRALGAVPEFPRAVSQFTQVGEESGRLAEMLEKLSNFYDAEVETTLERLSAALEPILIVGMGVMVGFMVIVAFAPMCRVLASLG